MQFAATPGKDEGVLLLEGELTLLNAEQLRDNLARAIDSTDRVIIDTDAVTDIDLACLQLLCSAHQSALSLGKQLVLHVPLSEVLTSKVAQAGLKRPFQCDSVSETECLWNGGKS